MSSSTIFRHCNATRVFFAAYHCMFISSTWEPVRFNHKSWTCPTRRLGQLHSRYHQKPLTKTLPHCTRSHFPRVYESVDPVVYRVLPCVWRIPQAVLFSHSQTSSHTSQGNIDGTSLFLGGALVFPAVVLMEESSL